MEVAVKVQLLEHKLADLSSQISLYDPKTVHLLSSRMNELTKDLNELKNLYSNPASSLNRVLDSLIRKVQDLEMAQYTSSQREKIKANDFTPHRIFDNQQSFREMNDRDDVLSHSN